MSDAMQEKQSTPSGHQEIDEALAWLEALNTTDGVVHQTQHGQLKPTAARAPSQGLPTWLRKDIKIEDAEPPIPAPVESGDNLSWLDGIASGMGAPLEEAPTMHWEETGMFPSETNTIEAKEQFVEPPTQIAPAPYPEVPLPEVPVAPEPIQRLTKEELDLDDIESTNILEVPESLIQPPAAPIEVAQVEPAAIEPEQDFVEADLDRLMDPPIEISEADLLPPALETPSIVEEVVAEEIELPKAMDEVAIAPEMPSAPAMPNPLDAQSMPTIISVTPPIPEDVLLDSADNGFLDEPPTRIIEPPSRPEEPLSIADALPPEIIPPTLDEVASPPEVESLLEQVEQPPSPYIPSQQEIEAKIEPKDVLPPTPVVDEVVQISRGGGDLADAIPNIPNDPDEAIAWLEEMAKKQKTAIPDPVEGGYATDKLDPPFDEVADALQEVHDIPEDSTLRPADSVTTPGQNNFVDELEEAMGIETPQIEDSLPTQNTEPSADDEPSLPAALPINEANGLISAEKPRPKAEDVPEDLSEALAWLEELVGGGDTSLDEMTIELDQVSVAELLKESSLPAAKILEKPPENVVEPEQKIVYPPVDPNGDTEATVDYDDEPPTRILPPPGAAIPDANFDTAPNQDEIDAVLESVPDPIVDEVEDTPTLIQETPIKAPKPTYDTQPVVERFDTDQLDEDTFHDEVDQGELAEALAWLESFAADESAVFGPTSGLGALPDDNNDETTVIDLFSVERIRIRDAFKEGKIDLVVREFSDLLLRDEPEAADIIIADTLKMIEQQPEKAVLYRVLGDAYRKVNDYEEAANVYRQALNLLIK